MSYLGDFATGSIVYGKFTTVDTGGIPFTLAGTPALSVYKDNSTTESTAGVTLTVSLDSRTGMNQFTIDTSSDGTFYAAGHDFQVVITAGTVSGSSVVGYVVGEFSIQNRYGAASLTAADVWAYATRVLTAGTNIVLAKGTGVTGFNDPSATDNADALLKRDWTSVTGEASRSVLNALRFLRNKWSIISGTLTVTKEDDTTSAWTGAVTTNPSDPVDSIDPS